MLIVLELQVFTDKNIRPCKNLEVQYLHHAPYIESAKGLVNV